MNLLASPTVTVGAAGTLKGTGVIAGNVTVNGTMAPGASIGTTTIIGDYVQAAGSTFECEVSPAAGDLLIVTGTTTIQPGATIQIIPEFGLYPPNLEYVVISSVGPLSGTFSTVSVSPFLFNAYVTYPFFVPQVWVVLQLSAFDSVITYGNAGKIAHCFDTTVLPPDNDFESVVEQLIFLNTDQELYDALDQMQPSALKALPLTQEDAALSVRKLVSARQAALYKAPCSSSFKEKPWTVWTTPTDQYLRQG